MQKPHSGPVQKRNKELARSSVFSGILPRMNFNSTLQMLLKQQKIQISPLIISLFILIRFTVSHDLGEFAMCV